MALQRSSVQGCGGLRKDLGEEHICVCSFDSEVDGRLAEITNRWARMLLHSLTPWNLRSHHGLPTVPDALDFAMDSAVATVGPQKSPAGMSAGPITND